MRSAVCILAACVWSVVAARPASACGEWKMTDTGRGLSISYLINAALIAKGDKRQAALYFDETDRGLRVARDHKVEFDVRNGKLFHYGTPIATMHADGTIVFENRTYAIEIRDPDTEHHTQISFHATVRTGDTTIIDTDDASALCAGVHNSFRASDELQKLEIRARIIYYLAWREVGL